MSRKTRGRGFAGILVATVPGVLAVAAVAAVASSQPAPAPGAAVAVNRTQQAPSRPHAVPRYTVKQFLATTAWTGASFSPDGERILLSGDPSGVFNAYSIPVAGGAPQQLTDSKVSAIFQLGWFPSGDRFLYSSDEGGNEQDHLYVRDAGGAVRDLTPAQTGKSLKAAFQGWATDDKTFFFTTNERDPHYFDLYEMTVDGYRRSLLWKNDGDFSVGRISRDRRFVALVKEESTSDSDVYLYPNEGHGFSRKETQIQANQAILDFLAKYLPAASRRRRAARRGSSPANPAPRGVVLRTPRVGGAA